MTSRLLPLLALLLLPLASCDDPPEPPVADAARDSGGDARPETGPDAAPAGEAGTDDGDGGVDASGDAPDGAADHAGDAPEAGAAADIQNLECAIT